MEGGRRLNPNEILVAGFAQFPKGTSLYESHRSVGCSLIIDTERELIVKAEFNILIGNDFIESILEGKQIGDGIDKIVEVLNKKLFYTGKKALIQSVISAYSQYEEFKQNQLPC